MIAPELESVRAPTGPGFSDAVAFAWGEPRHSLFGLVRLGLAPGNGAGAVHASALAIVFEGQEVVAGTIAGDVEASEPDWADLRVGAVHAATDTPLAEWRVSHDEAFDLRFRALSPAAGLSVAGSEGYEQVCHVQGTVRAGGRELDVDGLGQRGHAWGTTDWTTVGSVRTVSAWMGPDGAVMLQAVRPADASGQDDDAVAAVLVEGAGPGAIITPVARPRLSTTYDGDGRHRRAGLELWVSEEDEYPHRAAGDAVCGTTLELGRLRLELAFFLWRMEGRVGLGRYEVLRRA